MMCEDLKKKKLEKANKKKKKASGETAGLSSFLLCLLCCPALHSFVCYRPLPVRPSLGGEKEKGSGGGG